MPIFGSPGRKEEGVKKQEPAQEAEWLFPSVPSPVGSQPQAAHVTHGHSSQHVPVCL